MLTNINCVNQQKYILNKNGPEATSDSSASCFQIHATKAYNCQLYRNIKHVWETDLQKSIDFLLNPFLYFEMICM